MSAWQHNFVDEAKLRQQAAARRADESLRNGLLVACAIGLCVLLFLVGCIK